jgi:hypothetical protein
MSILGAFTGSSQKKAINAADKQATNALMQGYSDASGYYNQAADLYNPWIQQGQQGQTQYMNSLGLNGAAGSQAAYDSYMSNPAYQSANNYALGNLEKKYNAGGLSDSGANRLAMSRAAVEQYGAYQNQLSGLGQQGLQATGAQSGVRAGQGDMAMGYGATRAGQAINKGNALAQNASTGINNLLGLGGLGINAYTAWANPGAKR